MKELGLSEMACLVTPALHDLYVYAGEKSDQMGLALFLDVATQSFWAIIQGDLRWNVSKHTDII